MPDAASLALAATALGLSAGFAPGPLLTLVFLRGCIDSAFTCCGLRIKAADSCLMLAG